VTEPQAPRTTTDRSKTGRMFDRVGRGRPIPGNAVTLLQDSPEALEAMLALIASAQHWVHFDNYIVREDGTGQRFADALAERARAGVRVRVLSDWLGSFGTSRRFWRVIRDAGAEVRLFGPPRITAPLSFLSRNHRKVVIADGVRAITGGICIGDEWAGDAAQGIRAWRDAAVRIDGPAATALDQAFARTWAACGSPIPEDELATDGPPAGEAKVRVLAGEPGLSRMGRMAALVLAGASHRVWITDAYMVAPRSIGEAMADAARDGVDVRLLVPGSSDLPFIRNLTRTGYRALLAAGVRIFEWSGPMLHAKTTVTDTIWTRIGSTNLNWSSLLGNWELDVVIEDPAAAAEMESAFRRDMEQSAEVLSRPIRAPQPFQRVLPSALAIGRPSGSFPVHSPGRRERNQRRLVAVRALVTSARRALFGTAAMVLLGVAVLAFLVPRTIAFLLGMASLVLALMALRSALRGEPDFPGLD
jgi:cardiolipin synthase